MPRLPPTLLRQACAIDPRLTRLLPVCRDLPSAQSELRWLAEHAASESLNQKGPNGRHLLRSYIDRRARGEPLQYILGTEYFGDLELKCRPGVLIPRPETAASTSYLTRLLSSGSTRHALPAHLRILDLCTGSGAIPLLFHHDFYSYPTNKSCSLDVVGVDISETCLRLAMDNLARQLTTPHTTRDNVNMRDTLKAISFMRADVMSGDLFDPPGDAPSVLDALQQHTDASAPPRCDILISNPPYIAAASFRSTTSRSVRRYEPSLALVPKHASIGASDHDGDAFYPRIVALAEQLEAKIMLVEVADMDQATRVAAMAASERRWERIEIWRDDPTSLAVDQVTIDDTMFRVLGKGHGRSVFAYRGAAGAWMGRP
ncbi:hypothetical protein LTR53_008869 [Teratosphaeriaceae sp. CCFEE 6253]|nr:hypothetical protein LTR53_008869 [Teratosphaeriaceae sp. CCFEE 6253]